MTVYIETKRLFFYNLQQRSYLFSNVQSCTVSELV